MKAKIAMVSDNYGRGVYKLQKCKVLNQLRKVIMMHCYKDCRILIVIILGSQLRLSVNDRLCVFHLNFISPTVKEFRFLILL